jgi:5-amino-6-(5-phospho-D-ribitylamino)uracil phosphatase
LTECGYKIVAELQFPDIAEHIAHKFDCKLICYRGENWYGFVNKNSGKLQAIQELLKVLHISRNDVIAFGDDVNDIEMLKVCGLGIAVANAVSAVKEIANVIVDSNNEDGVAKYIEKEILNYY